MKSKGDEANNASGKRDYLSYKTYVRSSKKFEQLEDLSSSAEDTALLKLVTELPLNRTPVILDLGCGVGRYTIPLAKELESRGPLIICVDNLDLALARLLEYAVENGVASFMTAIDKELPDFLIEGNRYDLILAISSLEYAFDKSYFPAIIEQIKCGTHLNGLNYITINTDLLETDQKTGKSLFPQVEAYFTEDEALELLRESYSDWSILALESRRCREILKREEKTILAECVSVTLVGQKH